MGDDKVIPDELELVTKDDSQVLQNLAKLRARFNMASQYAKHQETRDEAALYTKQLDDAIKLIVDITKAREENTKWINTGERRIVPDDYPVNFNAGYEDISYMPYRTESKWYRTWYETEWRPE